MIPYGEKLSNNHFHSFRLWLGGWCGAVTDSEALDRLVNGYGLSQTDFGSPRFVWPGKAPRPLLQ